MSYTFDEEKRHGKLFQILETTTTPTNIKESIGCIYVGPNAPNKAGLLFCQPDAIKKININLDFPLARTTVLPDYVLLNLIEESQDLGFNILDIEIGGQAMAAFDSNYYPKTVIKFLLEKGDTSALCLALRAISKPITAVTFSVEPGYRAVLGDDVEILPLSLTSSFFSNHRSEYDTTSQIMVTLYGSGMISLSVPANVTGNLIEELLRRLTLFLINTLTRNHEALRADLEEEATSGIAKKDSGEILSTFLKG